VRKRTPKSRRRRNGRASSAACSIAKSGSSCIRRVDMDREEGRLVIWWRHGIAEERVGEKPDEERALTPDGQKKTKSVAKGLAELFELDAVIASPLVRAVQTALYVAKATGLKESVQTDPRLRPEATPKQ